MMWFGRPLPFRVRRALERASRLVQSMPGPAEHEVAIGGTYWTLNGVNIFSANLARGLTASGTPAHVLLTEAATSLVQVDEPYMPRPSDVSFTELPVLPWEGWGAHWGEMLSYLESRAPCVYLPNSDWRHSVICPRLSSDVVVVGIVHGDDPMHFDHVARLGKYWNAIVAVNDEIARRTAERHPELADRIVAIPNGARIPHDIPERVARADGALRVVYHGSLLQDPKRVLDLPLIVEAVAAKGVPVHLTVVGDGPDASALRAAAEPLIERRLMTMRGLVPPDEIPALLEAHDVFLLASELEGMPNALIEAMGCGCVPVVTPVGGIPSLVSDGRSGYLVPVGDVSTFAARLAALQHDPRGRRAMARRAHTSVSPHYRLDTMVADYDRLFRRLVRGRQRFVRPGDPVAAPPAVVGGKGVFPLALEHEVPGEGRFPTRADYEAYEQRVALVRDEEATQQLPLLRRRDAALGAPRADPQSLTVVVGAPVWTRNGVNVDSAKLLRGLTARGVDARLLLTEEETDLVTVKEARLPRPDGVRVDLLPVSRTDGWGAHWGALIRYLEGHAPCVYFPTFDWRHSCVIPRLSQNVYVVGSVWVADAHCLDHAQRLGDYWNAVVVPNDKVARLVRDLPSSIGRRLAVIPRGMDVPAAPMPRSPKVEPRVSFLVLDVDQRAVAQTVRSLAERVGPKGVTVRVMVAETGSTTNGLQDDESAFWDLPTERAPWPVPARVYQQCDAIIATGAIGADELWEAVGWGCIPILLHDGTDLTSGFVDGHDCVVVPSTPSNFSLARSISVLFDKTLREPMVRRGYESARRRAFRLDQAVDSYVELFERIQIAEHSGRFRRTINVLEPPPTRVAGTEVFPIPINHFEPGLGRFPTLEDSVAFQDAWPDLRDTRRCD